MTKKAQILVNGHDVRQSTALSGSGKAMDSHNAVKQGFPAGKCAINTQNQADFVYLNYAKQSQSQNSIPLKGAGREKGCRARREKSFGAPAH